MKRGELYRVYRATKNDPKDFRVFVVVSRQTIIDSKFSMVICAPIYSKFEGLSTQLEVGTSEGLKPASAIFCDELVSIPKSRLSHYVGSLSHAQLMELKARLRTALDLE